jgi:hypothetical protein
MIVLGVASALACHWRSGNNREGGLADPISGMSPVSVMLYEEDLLSPLVRLDIRVSLCWAKTCKMASSISPFWLSDSQNG